MTIPTKMNPSICIKKALSNEEVRACFAIRKKVFIEGQKVPVSEELDGKDEGSLHYLLLFNERPVGVSRVRFLADIAKIERVAILEDCQGQGLGKRLMCAILADLKANPAVSCAKLGAQTHAIPFYEKLGFIVCSEDYMDAGIPHKDMQLLLRK